MPDAMRKTGCSRSTIYLLMNKVDSPKSIPLVQRAIVWFEEEVENWMQELIN